MIKLSVRMLMMSHLSDVQEMLGYDTERANTRINFVKWLIGKYNDTSVEIDANEEWELFLKR